MRKKRVYDDDDGRTIADMSGVERRNIAGSIRGRDLTSADGNQASAQPETIEDKKTRRVYTAGALGAALLIGLVYIVIFGIVIALIYFLSK